jgi:hypothetical protein
MITKQYYIRVDYIPATYEDERQDGTSQIKHFDEVQDKVMNKDSRMVSYTGTPASDPYFECVVSSPLVAEHIHKFIQAVLTRYNYRII